MITSMSHKPRLQRADPRDAHRPQQQRRLQQLPTLLLWQRGPVCPDRLKHLHAHPDSAPLGIDRANPRIEPTVQADAGMGPRSVRGRGTFRLRSAWRRGPRQGDEIRVIAQRLEVRQVGQERRLHIRVRWGLPQGANGRLDALGPDFRS
jgi:hypothetical protein